MKPRRGTLVFLQYLWPCLAASAVVNTVIVTWAGTPGQVIAWSNALPVISGIVAIMAAAAGGGPLISDQIKAKAGILKGE